MFTAGNILHGKFQLKAEKKNKYAVVLYNDRGKCVLATYTTSKPRSGTLSVVHGKNPPNSPTPHSYVFKKGNVIGVCNHGTVSADFSFSVDTTVVPDYGYTMTTPPEFESNVDDLRVVCKLLDNEYYELIYTLYKSKKTSNKYKKIFESILEMKYGALSQ